MLNNPFRSLDDATVQGNLLNLAKGERDTGADILLNLLVVKERSLHVPLGFDSLFAYMVGELGFSRSVAYRRKAVLEKVEEFPELLLRLKDGRLHLCAAAAIATRLTTDNSTEILDAVAGLSQREVESYLLKRDAAQEVSLRPSAGTAQRQEVVGLCFADSAA